MGAPAADANAGDGSRRGHAAQGEARAASSARAAGAPPPVGPSAAEKFHSGLDVRPGHKAPGAHATHVEVVVLKGLPAGQGAQ